MATLWFLPITVRLCRCADPLWYIFCFLIVVLNCLLQPLSFHIQLICLLTISLALFYTIVLISFNRSHNWLGYWATLRYLPSPIRGCRCCSTVIYFQNFIVVLNRFLQRVSFHIKLICLLTMSIDLFYTIVLISFNRSHNWLGYWICWNFWLVVFLL